MPSWPTRGVMEKLIDNHFNQLMAKLNEILAELKTLAKARPS